MSGKGSGRRPGEGYEANWESIFGKKRAEDLPAYDPAEYLKTEDSRAAFLGDFEGESPDVIEQAQAVVKRSREILKED